MSTTKRKSSVRIVCPHCQRSYVIQVDLQRIFRTSPRAICARCGKRFDVIQRMSELEEANAVAEVADTHGEDEPGPPRGRVEHISPMRDLAAAERTKRSRASSEPSPPAAADASQEPGSHADPAARTEGEANVQPPLPLLASEVREPAATPNRRQAPSAPAPAPGLIEVGTTKSSLLPSRPPGGLDPPAAADLERPFPWADRLATQLELDDRAQPESAAALEWLLAATGASHKAG